jgi:hypothetical protein
MDVKIPLEKLFVAYLVLAIIVERKGNHGDQSASFARWKCTLEDASQTAGGPRPVRGPQEVQYGKTAL